MKSLKSRPDLLVSGQLATTFGRDLSRIKALSLPRRDNKRLGDVAITVGAKQTLVTLSGMVIGWNRVGSGPHPRFNMLALRQDGW